MAKCETPRDADAQRLMYITARRKEMPPPKTALGQHVDFLLSLLDARDAALRDANAECERLTTGNEALRLVAEAARRHIASYDPGTLIGSELNLALHLRDIDGGMWAPWCVPGTPDDRPDETASERVEIVAWLRHSESDWDHWEPIVNEAADRIERGEHKQPEPGAGEYR